MKLTTVTHVSLDGVIQGLGDPDEDRRGGFTRGGWALPLFDAEAGEFLDGVFARADAFLLGRRTYEIFEASWGTGTWGTDAGDNPISAALNNRPKYVVSRTLDAPRWAGTKVLPGAGAGAGAGGLAEAVRALKAGGAGELQVHGSGQLVRWLFAQGLVDEITLLVYPVVVGQGTRLFPDSGPDAALELLSSRSTTNGVTIQVHRPSGRPRYAAQGSVSS